MPLYSVTCGDIGTSPEAVEKYLNSVLHLGKKWNCGMIDLYHYHYHTLRVSIYNSLD